MAYLSNPYLPHQKKGTRQTNSCCFRQDQIDVAVVDFFFDLSEIKLYSSLLTSSLDPDADEECKTKRLMAATATSHRNVVSLEMVLAGVSANDRFVPVLFSSVL